MNIFELSSCFGIVAGAAGGAGGGFLWHGGMGALLGVPIGAIAGAFILPLLVNIYFLVGIYCEAGFAGVRKALWPGRGPGPG